MFISTSTGIVSATALPPRAAARLARGELVAVALGLLGVDREHVPVERPPAGERHRGHQLDLVVGEAAQAAVGDVLERGALVLAHRGAQREHFVAATPSATPPAGRRRRSA